MTTTTTTLKGDYEAFVSAFLRQVRRDPDLPSSGYRVAAEIAEHLNRKSRAAWPCQARLVANTGLSEATVKRVIGLLRQRGYLDLEPGEGRRSTVYRLVIVDREGSPVNPLDAGAEGSETTPQRVHPRPLRGFIREPSEGSPVNPDLMNDLTDAEASVEVGERDARARDTQSGARPVGAAPEKGEGRGREGAWADQPAAVEPEIIGPVAGGFEDLRAVFDRGWVEDHALAAQRYAAARREVGHAAILEGAQRWAATFAADNGGLCFLPPLDHWLEQRAWEMAPPNRKARSDAGGARKPFGKPNLGTIGRAYGARLAAVREARP
jgi:hypothetical protein